MVKTEVFTTKILLLFVQGAYDISMQLYRHYTLISVTGSGHIKYKKRRLPYKVKDKLSCQSHLLSYMAAGHIFYK